MYKAYKLQKKRYHLYLIKEENMMGENPYNEVTGTGEIDAVH